MTGTLGPSDISTRLERIAELARRAPDLVLTTLAHHIDLDLLHEAYRLTRKDGAVGVDGQTGADYEAGLEDNLRSLLERFKSGRYRAPPVRRKHIPKGDGSQTRPIGIPTFEDKVLQRAVTMVLGSVYEQDFLPCSYGFRPGRSAHQALEALWRGLMGMGGGWVLDVDIQGFFDALEPAHLRGFLDQRVRDGVLRRAVDKWLKAGVLEHGNVSVPRTGTPQGGVISPLLSNIYLHEVVDKWFETEVKPRLKGRAFLIRFADDLVIACSLEEDARKVMAVLPKRMGRYGLTLHPTKTRLVAFRRPGSAEPGGQGGPRGSFDFLGFTHHWARSRRGQWVVRRRTASGRFGRALHRVSDWCRRQRHLPLTDQHAALVRKLRGHFAYYGITGNSPALGRFRHEVRRTWHRWLCRRSRKAWMPWRRFLLLLARYPLPMARAVHSIYRHSARP